MLSICLNFSFLLSFELLFLSAISIGYYVCMFFCKNSVYCDWIFFSESRRTLSRLQSIRKSFRLTMRRIRNQSVNVMANRRRRTYDTPLASTGASAVVPAPPAQQREKRETMDEIQQRRDQLGNGVRCVQFANTFGPGGKIVFFVEKSDIAFIW